uniref:Nonstructural polyprotein n=1 Tax=Picornavirales sp. TaxID=1955153 RepID=A0A890UZI2_9VIRU|nr:MAG: nonstructural polyprotein [Picornavirales sp.]
MMIDGREQYISSFGQTVKGILPQGVIDSDLLRKACTYFSNHGIRGIYSLLGDIRLSPLTLEESFFGSHELDVARCNFESSVGPEDRFFKTRSGIFEDTEGALLRANPNFVAKIQEYIKQAKQNVVTEPWVCGANKDEIRSMEKLNLMQVRLFYTVDLYTNTAARMYLMPIINLMLRHPELFHCYGKMNSGSEEWETLFKKLSHLGRLLELDFKNFDISHCARIIREVAFFFYRLAFVWY